MTPLTTPLRALALCSTIALITACSSKADRIESGLAKGADYVRQADWDKASVEMRNVLQIDPKNAQAYYLAGQISEAKAEVQRAYGSYSKAVELKPDHLDAKAGLARLYILANRLEEAEKSIADVLAVNATHVGALTARAALATRRGDTEAAIAQARAVIAAQKAPPADATVLLAGLYTNQGRTAAALEVVDAALKAEPQHIGLMQVGAQVAAASSSPEERQRAVGYYKTATERSPRSTEMWTAWAVHHTRLNELDRAEEVLRAAIKSQPDDGARQLALLDFLTTRRGPAVAEKEYLAAIAAQPKDANLRFGLARLYRATGRPDDTRRVLEEIVTALKDTPAALTARNQLAADLLASGKMTQARALNGEVLTASPRDGAALLLRGRMLLADGDARGAVIDLRAAAKDQPGSPEVTGLLAQAHRVAGEPQLAREVLVDAVKFKPASPDLRLLLAADMADAKEYKAAGNEVEAALKAAPQSLRAHEMKAQLALAQKDAKAAEAVYASLKVHFPNDANGSLKLGQLYADQKKYDAALKEYENAAKLAPKSQQPVLSTIGVFIAQRRFDEAHQRIDALERAEPGSALPHRLRAEVAVARGDLPRAEQSYLKMIDAAPTSPAAYEGLARVMAQRGKVDDALAVLERGEKAAPSAPSIPALRAEWLLRNGRHADAISVYEGLLKRNPGDESTANNLAYLLIDSPRPDKANLERALSLTQGFKQSSNPGYLDTLGWTHYRLGQYADAVAALERAVQRAPEGPLYQLHLGLALHRMGDTARAQTHLRKAIDSKQPLPGLDEARTLLAMK